MNSVEAASNLAKQQVLQILEIESGVEELILLSATDADLCG